MSAGLTDSFCHVVSLIVMQSNFAIWYLYITMCALYLLQCGRTALPRNNKSINPSGISFSKATFSLTTIDL